MPDSPEKTKSSGWDIFKTLSTVFSSIVLAGAGLWATSAYNEKQIEIAQNRELAGLIPNLSSKDANVRKYSSISLALYGKKAIPALLAALDDENGDVRITAVKSLTIIGDAAVPDLTKAVTDKRNAINVRAGAIYALGRIGGRNVYNLAVSLLQDNSNDPIVRKDAAQALGFLKEQRQGEIEILLEAVRHSHSDVLTQDIVFAIGEISPPSIPDEVVEILRTHPNSDVRIAASWAVAKIRSDKSLPILAQVENDDTDPRVKDAARAAQAWAKTKG
jgi:HEAT repeat protein